MTRTTPDGCPRKCRGIPGGDSSVETAVAKPRSGVLDRLAVARTVPSPSPVRLGSDTLWAVTVAGLCPPRRKGRLEFVEVPLPEYGRSGTRS